MVAIGYRPPIPFNYEESEAAVLSVWAHLRQKLAPLFVGHFEVDQMVNPAAVRL